MKRDKLNIAKKRKYDEFYTFYSDIEKEVIHYKDSLKGKKVYCNCDSPSSEFVRYFTNNYETLGLTGFTATGYNKGGKGTLYTFDGTNAVKTDLQGDGSFDSQECIDILKKSDVVITNPPFSMIKYFIPLLHKEGKEFLIIAPIYVFGYSSVQPLLVNNQIRVGVTIPKYFYVPDDFIFINPRDEKTYEGKRSVSMGNTCWFTSMIPDVKLPKLKLTETYDPKKYPFFDNYKDIINVDKVKEIPKDYYGKMGVPLTYTLYHDPDEFEYLSNNLKCIPPTFVGGKKKFTRIFIRKKT